MEPNDADDVLVELEDDLYTTEENTNYEKLENFEEDTSPFYRSISEL